MLGGAGGAEGATGRGGVRADSGTGAFRSPPARRFGAGGHRPASQLSLGVTRGLRGVGATLFKQRVRDSSWRRSLQSASKGSGETVQPPLPRATLQTRGTQEAPQTARVLGGETGSRATLPASCCLPGRQGKRGDGRPWCPTAKRGKRKRKGARGRNSRAGGEADAP